MSKGVNSRETVVSIEKRPDLAEPPLYSVVLHNDDYTTMDFVVFVLESVFRKSSEEAYRIMLNVHLLGEGVCGCYPLEIAETKIASVHLLARRETFPLKCSLEDF